MERNYSKVSYFVYKPKAGGRGGPFSGVNRAFENDHLFLWITSGANSSHS